MVDQNLIASVKIPMSVVFSNIKINSCYQYYNRGENGAVVHSKVDASWGSVRSIGEIQDELVSIKQQIIDLLLSGRELNDPNIKSLSGRLEEIKIKDLVSWESDVKSSITNNITSIQNALNCSASSPNARTLCSTENALALLSNTELVGYEVVKEFRNLKNKVISTTCSIKNFEWCYGDKPKLTDSRFDAFGKANFFLCLGLGEMLNYLIYAKFVSLYGLEFMAENFKNKSGITLDLTDKSNIKQRVLESNELKNFSDLILDKIKNKILNNDLSRLTDSYIIEDVRSPNFSIVKFVFPTSAYAAIGGTQAFELNLTLYRKKGKDISNISSYSVDYKFKFWDTYGADYGDINFGSKGSIPALNSFFTLHHEYGYGPYLVFINIQKTHKF